MVKRKGKGEFEQYTLSNPSVMLEYINKKRSSTMIYLLTKIFAIVYIPLFVVLYYHSFYILLYTLIIYILWYIITWFVEFMTSTIIKTIF